LQTNAFYIKTNRVLLRAFFLSILFKERVKDCNREERTIVFIQYSLESELAEEPLVLTGLVTFLEELLDNLQT
jgi:hypothetical protein